MEMEALYAEVKAAMAVLFGGVAGDARAADAFLRAAQEKPQCVWMGLAHIPQAESAEEATLLAAMVKHALGSVAAALDDADKQAVFHKMMEVLAMASTENAPLIFELSLGVGHIISQLQNNPCQTLLNTDEFQRLNTATRLRLLTILPECSLWLDRAETQAVVNHILQTLETATTSDMYLALPCLAAWFDLPTCAIGFDAALQEFPQLLQLTIDVLSLRTEMINEASLHAVDLGAWEDSLPLKLLFAAIELVESLLLEAPAELTDQVLGYYSAIVDAMYTIQQAAPTLNDDTTEDVISRKLAMLAVQLSDQVLQLLTREGWDRADAFLNCTLRLVMSVDIGVAELLIMGNVFESIITQIRGGEVEAARQPALQSFLEELANVSIQRCAYPSGWTSWDDALLEEEDFNRFRLVHCRDQFMSLCQVLGARLAQQLLAGIQEQQSWEAAEAYLFAAYCCATPLYSASKNAEPDVQFQIQMSLWELVQKVVGSLQQIDIMPFVATALSVIGECHQLFVNQTDALAQTAELVVQWLGSADSTVCDAAAVAFAKLTMADPSTLAAPERLEHCVTQAINNMSAQMPIEGMQRLHEGLMRISTNAIDRIDGAQATFTVLNSMLDRISTHLAAHTGGMDETAAHGLRALAEVLRTASYYAKPFANPERPPLTRQNHTPKIPHELWQSAAPEFVRRLWDVCDAALNLVRMVSSLTRGASSEVLDCVVETFSLLVTPLVEVFKFYIKDMYMQIVDGLITASSCSGFVHASPLQTCVSVSLTLATELRRENPELAGNILSGVLQRYTEGLKVLAAGQDTKNLAVYGFFFSLVSLCVSYATELVMSLEVFHEILVLAISALTTNTHEIATQAIELLRNITFRSRKGSDAEKEALAGALAGVGRELVFHLLAGVAHELPIESLPRTADMFAPLLHHPVIRPHLRDWLQESMQSISLSESRYAQTANGELESLIEAIMAIGDALVQPASTNISVIEELRTVLLQLASLARESSSPVHRRDLQQFARQEAYGV